MKRLFLLGFIGFSLFCQASDIIVTKSNEQIKCTIDGTDASEIKFTTVDGGKYTLPIAEVATLLYEDGRVEQINSSQSEPTSLSTEDEYLQPITQYDVPIQPIDPYASQTTEKPKWNEEEISSMPKHEIVKVGKRYYMDDKEMSQQLYMRFLQKNCPKAYKQEKSWGAFFGTGLAGITAGGTLTLLGGLFWGLGQSGLDKTKASKHYSPKYSSTKTDENMVQTGKTIFAIGFPLLVTGGLLMSIGVPWSKKGYQTYNRSLDTPQTAMREQPQLRLNVITHGNDIGLALLF